MILRIFFLNVNIIVLKNRLVSIYPSTVLAKEGKLLKRSEEWNLFFNVHNDAAPAVRLHKR